MNNAPIVILQMQRMGDLVLSFPLLGWLGRLFPSHPLWVVGERRFFDPLMPLSPQVTYFSYQGKPSFNGLRCHMIINLSHRAEAATLAGATSCDVLVGPWMNAEGHLFIAGDWQLYRTSLTGNNRYNQYHWADLNALDCIPAKIMEQTLWPLLKVRGDAEKDAGARIGLFLGASEAEKHPDVEFWAALCKLLLSKGHHPVLLGGIAELPLGNAVATKLKTPALNLCGRFSISGLARFIGALSLLITPDTGPMHIASWLGTPLLNLSLGPVNPWETGPFTPGNHVLRPALDCSGCWQCEHKTHICRKLLKPADVARLAQLLLSGKEEKLHTVSPALEILRSAREKHGLFSLLSLSPSPFGPESTPLLARRALSSFWQAWFGALFGRFTQEEADDAWTRMKESHPATAHNLHTSIAAFLPHLAKAISADPTRLLTERSFWQQADPALRPFSGYLQMYVQNASGSRPALTHALVLTEKLAALT